MKHRLHFTLLTAGLIGLILLSGCVTSAGEHDGDGRDVDGGKAGIGMIPPSPSRAMVEALNAWDDVGRAIDLYSHAIEIDPEFALAYFKRAELLRHIGAFELALDDYTRAIEIEPGFLQAYVERGFFRMWELGDEAGAEDIERAYSIDPNDVPTALAFVDLLEWSEPEHALEILNRLTAEHPDHPGPFLRRAKMRRNQGEYAAAAEDFAQAIRRGLDEPWIRTERAMVLVAAGELTEALRETEIAFEQDPDSPDVALMRARLTILIGGPDSAGRFYQAYLESEWVHQPVKLEAAFVAAAGGEMDRAGDLIRSYEEMEDDPLRAQLAEAGALALAGESGVAGDRALQIVRDQEWYAPAWAMLAAIAVANRDAVPPEFAEELELRIAEMRPDLRRLVFDHTELLIWLRLFGEEHPEIGDLNFTFP